MPELTGCGGAIFALSLQQPASVAQKTDFSLFATDANLLKSLPKQFAQALLSEDIPTDCAGDLANLGVTPEQWAGALNSVVVLSRPGSGVPLASTLPNGSVDQQTAQQRNLTVGGQFNNAGVTAWASVNGPQVWINPNMVNPGDTLADAALIAHETLHNLGMLDPAIQSALGITVSAKNTKNISDKLQQDCFPGLSGPTLLP